MLPRLPARRHIWAGGRSCLLELLMGQIKSGRADPSQLMLQVAKREIQPVLPPVLRMFGSP